MNNIAYRTQERGERRTYVRRKGNKTADDNQCDLVLGGFARRLVLWKSSLAPRFRPQQGYVHEQDSGLNRHCSISSNHAATAWKIVSSASENPRVTCGGNFRKGMPNMRGQDLPAARYAPAIPWLRVSRYQRSLRGTPSGRDVSKTSCP
jgi:hypothetical protein